MARQIARSLWAWALLVVLASVQAGAAEAYDSASAVRPLLIGSEVPSVPVLALDGSAVDLRDVIGEKRAVVVFYRGGWWPYCSKQLGQLQAIESNIEQLGFELIAISGDKPENIARSVEKQELAYALYSGKTMAAARAYGIAFTVDAAGLAQFESFGIDLEAASGETHHQLPVPSVFVYRDGIMQFQHVNPDYSIRLDGDVLLAAVRAAAR